MQFPEQDKPSIDCASDQQTLPQQEPTDYKLRFDFSSRVHVYINEYVRFADTKAALILAACGSLFTVPMTRADGLGELASKANGPHVIGLILTTVLLVFSLIYTVFYCIKCIYPNLTSSGTSKVFFGDIAGKSAEEYKNSIASMNAEDLSSEIADHCYWVSRVALNKYQMVQRAIWGLGAVLVLCIVLTIALLSVAAEAEASKERAVSATQKPTIEKPLATQKLSVTKKPKRK